MALAVGRVGGGCVGGLGAGKFGLPGGGYFLRARRVEPEDAEVVMLAATDPANPYGAILPWTNRGPTRSVGASVVIVDGTLAAYLARGDRQVITWLPEDEPRRTRTGRGVAQKLIDRAREMTGDQETLRGMLIEEIDGQSPARHPLAPFLIEAGFLSGALGFQATFPSRKMEEWRK